MREIKPLVSAARIRRRASYSLVLLLLLLASVACAAEPLERADPAEQDAGARLAQALYDRPDGRTVAVRARMTLRSPGSRDRVREFYSYRADFPAGEVRTLTRFVAPGNIAGTGLLVHSHVNATDDQWLYLPALKRIRRISGENRGGRFVQSGIYYEDLQDRLPDEDTHRIVGTGDYEGVEVTLLESIPVDPRESVYSKRISWIHPDLNLPLRIDYFQGAEAPVKRLEARRVDRIQGYWTVTESVIMHPATGEETVIENLVTRYDAELSEELFGTRALSDARLEEDLRPQ
ncbi:MAG: outer membrane lipoprotein-sorting protein [Halieaceae bacterium]|nr:outer membrane lipoprotein-sorting protein [Halieaceae bacterium]